MIIILKRSRSADKNQRQLNLMTYADLPYKLALLEVACSKRIRIATIYRDLWNNWNS